MNLIIDKTNWKKVALNDVAIWYQKDIPNDKQTDFGIKNYITANHIDSDAVKITRFGLLEDGQKGPTITKHFLKNDLLFSTRSVELRKAALAPVEGVTGEKLLVLRCKKDSELLNEFFPFIFCSNDFWAFAQNSAAGSVNKFTSWTKIREYEFLLPPKDQQAKLAELLWAMDAVVEKEVGVLKEIRTFLRVKREDLIINRSFDWVRLEDICKKKISYGIVQAGPNIESGMPYIKSSDLSEEGIATDRLQKTSLSIASKYRRSEVTPGDIVFYLRGNLGQMNIVPPELEVANLTQGTARLSVKQNNNVHFVKFAIETDKVQRRISALSKGSTFSEISLEALRSVKIPMPDKKLQDYISFLLCSAVNAYRISKSKISASKSLQKSLINQIF